MKGGKIGQVWGVGLFRINFWSGQERGAGWEFGGWGSGKRETKKFR
jgi:hypothetical protein